jgi:hypothetical protein
VLWGAYHGALLVVHRLLKPVLSRVRPASLFGTGLWRLTRVLVLFHLVVLGWLPFRAHTLDEVRDVLLGIVQRGGPLGEALTSLKWLVACTGLLMLLELAEEWRPSFLESRPFWARGLLYFAVLAAIFIAGVPGGQTFIYFQF